MSHGYDRELDEFDRHLSAKGYEPLEPFFVLREGSIADERNGGTVKLDKARLERIAAIQNERVATTGDATPIIIGHTRRNLLEKDQPEVTGLATRFSVTKFKNTNSWGLQAVPWAEPGKKVNFERYKRRSCELWTDPDLIDPISLLGANTPRLDLGLHQLQRNGYRSRTPLTLEMAMADDNGGKPGDADTPAGGQNTAAAEGTQTSEFAQMKAQLAELMQMKDMLAPLLQELQQEGSMGQGQPPGAPPGAPPGGPPGGPPVGPAGPAPGPIQAMGTPPGGMNTMMPQQFGRDGQPLQFQHVGYGQDGQPLFRQVPVAAPQQPLQFQHPQQALYTPPTPYQTPAAGQSEVEALRTQVASLQLARMGDEVTLILNDLERKIVIDRPRDHARLIKMSKADRDADVQFMLNTRKAVEEPLPQEALPLQFHMQPPQTVGQQNIPIQFGMDQGMYMAPDPNLGKTAPGTPKAVSAHDALMEIVRNRGKLGTMEAYEAVMNAGANGNGQQRTPVR